jgi:hypothetical protein
MLCQKTRLSNVIFRIYHKLDLVEYNVFGYVSDLGLGKLLQAKIQFFRGLFFIIKMASMYSYIFDLAT